MKNIDLLVTFTLKEISLKYRHTVLGASWLIINPLLQMLVIGFVFQNFIKVQAENYFEFLFLGLVIWNFFSIAVNRATPSLVNERELIQKTNFPREIIPISAILAVFFQMVISLGVFLIYLLFRNLFVGGSDLMFSEALSLILLLPIVGWLLLFSIALSLALSVFQVRYRDVQMAVQAFMPLWFYATPVMYDIGFLPEPVNLLLYLNPLTWVFESMQWLLLKIEPVNQLFWFIGIAEGLALIVVAAIIFNRRKRHIIDWL